MAYAQTGRLASTDPNLQNIPVRTEEGRKIREAFIPERWQCARLGGLFADRLRILAHMSDIPALKKAFMDGLDIHAMTASEMFGVPVEGMDPMVRRQAKAINFGIIYGILASASPASSASRRQRRYRLYQGIPETLPGIRQFMDDEGLCPRDRLVRTAYGRKIHLPDMKAKGLSRAFAERQAINAPLQGTAADIIKRAMIRMPDAIAAAGLKAKMLLQVHDELVFECAEKEAAKLIEVAQETMSGADGPSLKLSVPLVVEAKAAMTWAAAH